jgi:uncharacterized membrane protein YeaQ/YmgE (transglycosylase-associated protein family)
MNIIIWLVVGGILGWLASLVMKTDGQQGIFLNVVVGIVGALIAGFLIAPLFGTGTINSNDFSMSGLLVSFLGAAVLLAIVNMFRRGTHAKRRLDARFRNSPFVDSFMQGHPFRNSGCPGFLCATAQNA